MEEQKSELRQFCRVLLIRQDDHISGYYIDKCERMGLDFLYFDFNRDEIRETEESTEVMTYIKPCCQPYNLFFYSLNEIKKGDWYLKHIKGTHIDKWDLIQANNDICTALHINCFKIEASTQSRINVPLIPKSFISKFIAERGEIYKVDLKLEFGKFRTTTYDQPEYWVKFKTPKIAVNNINEVIIDEYIPDDETIYEDLNSGRDDNDSEVKTDPLEEAASYKYPLSSDGDTQTDILQLNCKGAFKAGALWQQEKNIIDFLIWIEKECTIKNGRVMHGLQSVPSSHKKLYELWQKK